MIAVILVLTRMYAFSGQLSRRAEVLTRAVHLAENAAEAVAASDGMDTLRSLLEVNGNVEISGEGAILQARYDEAMQPLAGGIFCVEVTWTEGDFRNIRYQLWFRMIGNGQGTERFR